MRNAVSHRPGCSFTLGDLKFGIHKRYQFYTLRVRRLSHLSKYIVPSFVVSGNKNFTHSSIFSLFSLGAMKETFR